MTALDADRDKVGSSVGRVDRWRMTWFSPDHSVTSAESLDNELMPVGSTHGFSGMPLANKTDILPRGRTATGTGTGTPGPGANLFEPNGVAFILVEIIGLDHTSLCNQKNVLQGDMYQSAHDSVLGQSRNLHQSISMP